MSLVSVAKKNEDGDSIVCGGIICTPIIYSVGGDHHGDGEYIPYTHLRIRNKVLTVLSKSA